MTRPFFTLSLFVILLAAAGCGGSKQVPAEGVVKLDGKPVEGAQVTFISDDGKHSFTATTDAAGLFSLFGGDGAGALPGNYKVTVIKTAAKKNVESLSLEDAGKMMKKDYDDAAKANKGASDPKKMMMGGKGGMMPPQAGMMGGPVNVGQKSELPAIYASGVSTPITAKIPSEGPIAIDLKSKP